MVVNLFPDCQGGHENRVEKRECKREKPWLQFLHILIDKQKKNKRIHFIFFYFTSKFLDFTDRLVKTTEML